MKKVIYTEAAYLIGLVMLALGASFMERASFGMSMVVAPAYLIYLKVSQYYAWFTFGMAEYCFQALLLILLSVAMMRFKKNYLFSFVSAFIYGNILDLFMRLIALIPGGGFPQRILFFVMGAGLCAGGVSFLFHTYITPEAYELVVKEVSAKYGIDINKVKTAYDCCSCVVAIVMSFLFYGFLHFEGVKAGTMICALVNGWLIGKCSLFLEKHFEFKDGLRRKVYQND
ncbi:MAG: DUF6198 family protein [Lachnospiraceae bacterium]|nr:DUF6198 family protein [Lachnospiraceae bacterium]